MRNFLDEYVIFNNATKLKAAFTAETTDIITSNGHGLSDGDCVILTNSGGALPAGLSTATNYYVRDADTNTFKLSTTIDGSAVNITGTGTGTHSFNLMGKVIAVSDFRTCVISINTANSSAYKIRLQGSITATAPNFNIAQSATNNWDYIQTVDLNSGSAIEGDTGITLTGTDDNRLLEANMNALSYLTVEVSSWTAGTMNCKIKVFDNQ